MNDCLQGRGLPGELRHPRDNRVVETHIHGLPRWNLESKQYFFSQGLDFLRDVSKSSQILFVDLVHSSSVPR